MTLTGPEIEDQQPPHKLGPNLIIPQAQVRSDDADDGDDTDDDDDDDTDDDDDDYDDYDDYGVGDDDDNPKDDLDLNRYGGSTASSQTGPHFDYTTGTG